MDPTKKVVFVEPDGGGVFRLKGIEIEQLLGREYCARFSAYRVIMKPHQEKKPSFHKSGEELYYVLSGEGVAVLGDEEFHLRPGCFFRVPPRTLHRFQTRHESLEMLNFHSPPVFADQDTYFPEE
ncbi:MAG: cupin domain-containing protein [Nitrospinales bacterium]